MLTEFGKMCRKIRIDSNELLADMADKLGVSASFLSAVENGKRNVPEDWLGTIGEEYALSQDERKELRDAARDSVRQIKIQMKDLGAEDRDLVLSFARNFERLDRNDRDKILRLLQK